MLDETIRSHWPARHLALMGFLAALVMASEVGAGGLFPSPKSFAAGDTPVSVAVADLDGDSVPDLVTANFSSDDVAVLINLPEPTSWLMLIAGAALLSVLHRRRIRASRVH